MHRDQHSESLGGTQKRFTAVHVREPFKCKAINPYIYLYEVNQLLNFPCPRYL